ncbi:MAG TPA: DUF456 domain-containing protein [Gemmatimonadales bacterium]|nr:DUF456 domain-containing protein [Gemmatimonadales bacterium]
MLLALLLLSLLAGLALIPLGLPGLWLMALGVVGYGWLTGFVGVSSATIAIVVGLALLGELVEWGLGFQLAKRYGGSRQAGWGALLGGLVGAFVGVPLPIIGSVIGAFLGSCAGAAAFEYLHSRDSASAWRAGWGALVGRSLVTAGKVALGFTIAVIAVFAAVRR